MRLVIIGIDALDITMINKLNLMGLKQAQHGALKVPLNSVSGYPRSSSVWASFLVGQEREIEFIRNSEGINTFRGLDEKAFLDLDGVKGINVPYHDHEVDTATKLVRLRKKLRWWPWAHVKMVDIHNSRTVELFNEIGNSSDYKVLFAFIQTLDTLSHALYLRPKIIKNVYRTMEIEFMALKRKLVDDMIIIVSDHGFQYHGLHKGYHSYTGFYSCNHILDPKPANITDFYEMVKAFLKGEEIT